MVLYIFGGFECANLVGNVSSFNFGEFQFQIKTKLKNHNNISLEIKYFNATKFQKVISIKQ